jgi:hypothetical protein
MAHVHVFWPFKGSPFTKPNIPGKVVRKCAYNQIQAITEALANSSSGKP